MAKGNGSKTNRVGALWINDREGTKVLSLSIDAEAIKSLTPDSKGRISITGLVNSYKKKQTDPHFNLVETVRKGKGTTADATKEDDFDLPI